MLNYKLICPCEMLITLTENHETGVYEGYCLSCEDEFELTVKAIPIEEEENAEL